jgi:hypothetical protein
MSATENVQRLLNRALIDLQRAESWGAMQTMTYYEGRIRAFQEALRAIKEAKHAEKRPGARGEVRDRASDNASLPPGKETNSV